MKQEGRLARRRQMYGMPRDALPPVWYMLSSIREWPTALAACPIVWYAELRKSRALPRTLPMVSSFMRPRVCSQAVQGSGRIVAPELAASILLANLVRSGWAAVSKATTNAAAP
jgi:hypothetical protein